MKKYHIIPEMHDILKLLECPLLHNYPESLDVLINSDYFFTFKHHEKKSSTKYAEKINTVIDNKILPENFLLSFADTRASTIARMDALFNDKNVISQQVFMLWQEEPFKKNIINKCNCKLYDDCSAKDKEEEIKKCRFHNEKNRELIADVVKCVNENGLVEILNNDKWLYELKKRAEDTNGSYFFSSLYTHCLLTKAWYEFFKNNSISNSDKFFTDFSDLKEHIQQNEDVEKYEKEKKYQLLRDKTVTLLRIKLHTYVKLARLKDIRIIEAIPAILSDINNCLKGSILYCFGHEKERLFVGNEIFLVTANDDINNIESRITSILNERYHYYADIKAVRTLLYADFDRSSDSKEKIPECFSNNDFENCNHNLINCNYKILFPDDADSNSFDKNNKLTDKRLHPSFPKELPYNENVQNENARKRILCELCQMAPAENEYPDDKKDDAVKEYLCSKCNDKRKFGLSKNMQAWDTEGDSNNDVKLCFVMISIDMGKLCKVLKNLLNDTFESQLKNPIENILSTFGLPILNEFLVNYWDFLKKFNRKIFNDLIPNEENHEKIWNNLFCLKIEEKSKLADILNTFYELFANDFPKLKALKEGEHPITLTITYSPIKFPFYKHWDMLTRAKSKPLNVYLINSTKLETDFQNYEILRTINGNERVNAELHRVAEIEMATKSSLLTEMEFIKFRDRLGAFYDAVTNIDKKPISVIDEILPYYKIQDAGAKKR